MALGLNSPTDYLIRTSGFVDYDAARTVFFRVKVRTQTATSNTLIHTITRNTAPGVNAYDIADWVGLVTSGTELNAGCFAATSQESTTGDTLSANTWYSIAMVRESTTVLKYYLNGSLTHTLTTNVSARSNGLYECFNPIGGTEYVDMVLEGYKEWAAALNATEISTEHSYLDPARSANLNTYCSFATNGAATTGTAFTLNGTITTETGSGAPLFSGGGLLTPAGTGAQTVAGNAPVLSKTLAPPAGAVSVVGNAPAITNLRTSPPGVVTVSGNAPTLIATGLLNPSTGIIALAGNAATLLPSLAPSVGAVSIKPLLGRQLFWTASGDGNGYAVGVDTVSRAGSSATAASYANVYDAGASTSYTANALVSGTTYYVGVSSYETFGDTALYSIVDVGDEFSFVASGTVPRVLNLVPPTGSMALVGNAPALIKPLVPAVGALSVVGNAPTLTRILTPPVGQVSIVSASPSLVGNLLSPPSGSVVFTGNSPARASLIWATEAVVTVTGNVPALVRILSPATGSFAYAGIPPDGGPSLVPIPGVVSIAGNVPPLVSRLFPQSGAIAVTSSQPTPILSLVPNTGAVHLTGNIPARLSGSSTLLSPAWTGVVAMVGEVPELLIGTQARGVISDSRRLLSSANETRRRSA